MCCCICRCNVTAVEYTIHSRHAASNRESLQSPQIDEYFRPGSSFVANHITVPVVVRIRCCKFSGVTQVSVWKRTEPYCTPIHIRIDNPELAVFANKMMDSIILCPNALLRACRGGGAGLKIKKYPVEVSCGSLLRCPRCLQGPAVGKPPLAHRKTVIQEYDV
jgi:hypothetical protein